MKRQFTVITKDGSKWLRPTDVLSDVFNVIYIGTRPEGTVLDESEVKEIVQYRQKDNENADWKIWTTGVIDWDCVIETRTAYTDAESHDRQISDEYPGIDYQPLFNHMSKVHGLTLTAGEMDEIIGLSTYILAKK